MVVEAVIPAAGRGTRFLPLTKEQPKELLPVVDKPVIHYVVEEAAKAGIGKVLVVTGRHKRSLLEDYFDRSPDLERLNSERVTNSLKLFENLPQIYFVRQSEPKGLGDAVLRAKNLLVAQEGFFAVMLGDTINISKTPVVKQLIEAYRKLGDADAVIAVEKVRKEKVRDYGIVDVGETLLNGAGHSVRRLVEKPKPETAPSNLGITGTYVFSKKLFDYLEKTKPDARGEVQLTDALQLMVEHGHRVVAYRFEGRRFDIGDIRTWMEANLELTFRSPEYGASLRKYALQLLKGFDDP